MDFTERYRYGLAQPYLYRNATNNPYRKTRSSTATDQAISRFIDRLLARDNELVLQNNTLVLDNADLVRQLARANKRLFRMRQRIAFLIYRLSMPTPKSPRSR
jgi:hypothetical protein